MKIEDLQAGDVLVFEHVTMLVTRAWLRSTGPRSYAYMLNGKDICYAYPPSEDDLGTIGLANLGAFKHLLRPRLDRVE